MSKANLPTDAKARKDIPLARGLLDYFPDALAAVAHLSKVGNDQHNPGEPMHWAREKSTDQADCIMRHLMQRGYVDTDGILHDVKVAWRALALAQLALETLRKVKEGTECLTRSLEPNGTELTLAPSVLAAYTSLSKNAAMMEARNASVSGPKSSEA